MLKTISRSELGSESVLVSFADAEGRIIRTIDSSNILVSYTDYQYNPAGQLVKVVSASSDSAHRSNEGEQHLWQWGDNKPVRMLRIKNKVDTTFVDFKLDQDGDVSEEKGNKKTHYLRTAVLLLQRCPPADGHVALIKKPTACSRNICLNTLKPTR